MKLMMKRKIVLRLSILTVLLTFLWSCRNEDLVQADKNPLRNNSEFFNHTKNGGANARAGVDYIDILESYNKEKDFLAQMPDQQGMPIWEKMQIVDAEGATGLMIPLSHDNETMSSILFATIDEKNSVIGVKDYDNSLLEKIVYDGKIDKKFREQMFYTFMYVDNRTFGTTEFTHIPKDLFEGTKRRNEEYGRMKFTDFTPSPKVSTQQNGKVLLIETCAVTWHCTHHGGGGPCDYCSECYGMVCSTTMISVADDPFPGTPGSSGGGGGGLPPSGPEGNIPSNDPCGASTSVFYRLAPGCSGSGNPDLPELDDITDPCNNLKKLLNPTKANLKPLITNNMYSYINDNSPGETGIFIKKDPNGNISTELSAPSTSTNNELPTPTGPNYYSGVHTHPRTTYPILSYKDIYSLYLLDHNTGVHNAGQASVVMVCEDDAGIKQTYALVFENTGQTLQQIWTNPENNGCPIKDLIDILFKKLEKLCNEEEEKTNPDYERVFLQFTFGDNIGLYKANNDLTNWSKLTINENSDTAVVTPINCN